MYIAAHNRSSLLYTLFWLPSTVSNTHLTSSLPVSDDQFRPVVQSIASDAACRKKPRRTHNKMYKYNLKIVGHGNQPKHNYPMNASSSKPDTDVLKTHRSIMMSQPNHLGIQSPPHKLFYEITCTQALHISEAENDRQIKPFRHT
jgi:hypothetical protein